LPKKTPKHASKKKPTFPFWKNLVLELILIGAGVCVIAYGLTYRVPNAIPVTYRETLTVDYQNSSEIAKNPLGQSYTFLTPPISLLVETTFNAQGTFGADNPITIHAVIHNANNTVTNYYCCLDFLNAVPVNNPSDSEHSWLPLKNWQNGTYTADGVLEWPNGGPTYTWLLPNPPPNGCANYRVPNDMITSGGRRSPTLTIGPISDTLTWQNDQRNTQLVIYTLGVIIFGPYEVVKRLVYRRNK
jgi:hypothetical protein